MKIIWSSKNILFILLFSLSTLASSLTSFADIDFDPGFDGQFFESGYILNPNQFEQSFFLYDLTKYLYLPSKVSDPYHIKFPNVKILNTAVSKLEEYVIDKKNASLQNCTNNNCSNNFYAINGVTERQMVEEIITSSYCFGSDPFVISSKIRQESKFDSRAISPTGAIGLTQLTQIGLEEILDQLGHRGPKYASKEASAFINKALSCYADSELGAIISDFPVVNTETRRNRIYYTPQTILDFKKWFSYKNDDTQEQKRIVIKRQIFLGQVLLKIYLTYSYATAKNKTMMTIYDLALRMFNGDKMKVKYAKEVLKKSIPNVL